MASLRIFTVPTVFPFSSDSVTVPKTVFHSPSSYRIKGCAIRRAKASSVSFSAVKGDGFKAKSDEMLPPATPIFKDPFTSTPLFCPPFVSVVLSPQETSPSSIKKIVSQRMPLFPAPDIRSYRLFTLFSFPQKKLHSLFVVCNPLVSCV